MGNTSPQKKPKWVLRFHWKRGADVFAISPFGLVIQIGIDASAGCRQPHIHQGILETVSRQAGVSKSVVKRVATGRERNRDIERLLLSVTESTSKSNEQTRLSYGL